MISGLASSGTNRWIILWVIFLARTSMGYQFQSVGSVGPALIERLAMDFAMLGTLIGLYKFPGLFLALPSGFLGRRFGLKLAATTGLALMAVGGLVTAGSESYSGMALGRVVSGTGAILFNVLSAAIMADWFDKKELTLAMALYVNSWPLGIALGLATQALLLSYLSVDGMMLITAIFCALGWLLLAVTHAEPREGKPGPSGSGAYESVVMNRSTFALVSLAAMVWLMFNAGLLIMVGFSPAYLVSNGVSIAEAGNITSVGTWLGIITIPVMGYVVQKWGHANLAMILFLSAGGIVTWLIPATQS